MLRRCQLQDKLVDFSLCKGCALECRNPDGKDMNANRNTHQVIVK